MATIFSRLRTAVAAFREEYVSADVFEPTNFEDFEARKVRYQMLWAWYENTAYRNIHTWAKAYRNKFSLYKYIRNVYNPAYRLTEFWKMMIWGGVLDPHAAEKEAVPIVTDSDELRDSIAFLWNASNWPLNKDKVVLWGCALGDVAIKVVDDPGHKEMRLEVIHPATLKEVELDRRGHVKSYEIEETRELEGKEVTYLERVTRGEGETVKFETFADDKLYAWNEQADTWEEPYGFIPLVVIQHNDVGFNYGWSEMHPLRSKDYIRKAIDPVWLFNFRKPKTTAQVEHSDATSDVPDPGREEMPALYVSEPSAKGQPLVTDMIDLEKTTIAIQKVIEELERDMPELQMDIWTVGGYTTGKALRTARQRVERKVIQRRPTYDSALMRAHQMAIGIGGWRNYPGYDGFNLESYEKKDLEHYIPATRSIFKTDQLDQIEIKQSFWTVVMDAEVNKHVPMEMVLEDLGWPKSKIVEYMSKRVEEVPDEESGENNGERDAAESMEDRDDQDE